MADKISDSLVAKMEPPRDKANVITYDTDVKGFGVRITKAGARSFILNYRIKGVERRYTIGSYPDWKATAAREKAKALKREIAQGRDPMGERHEERATPTLAAISERYINEYAKPYKKARTVEEDQRNLKLHILPALGNRKITDISRADVDKFHGPRRDTPVNANRCLALLSHMFTMAEKWEVRQTGTNPCRHVDKFPENRRERFLSPKELSRLGDALANAEGAEPASAIAGIRLLLLTGCRLSEIMTLEWNHVDVEAGCLRLPDSKTRQKIVPLGAAALTLLAELPREEGNPFVLPAARSRRGANWSSKTKDAEKGHFVGIQYPWQRIRTAAKLPDTRLHDLRHSFASVAVAGGDSLYLIGKVLGHKQARTTERYAHLHDDPLRAVADRTSEKIAAMMKPDQGSGADVVSINRR